MIDDVLEFLRSPVNEAVVAVEDDALCPKLLDSGVEDEALEVDI